MTRYRIIRSDLVYIDIRESEFEKAIQFICKENLTIFIADLDSELDFVFCNVPKLNVRKYAPNWDEYHPNNQIEFEEFGDAEKHQDNIFCMFGFSLDNAPVPTEIGDWEGTKAWMKHITK